MPINLSNGIEHVVGTLAAYKLGCPMPVSYRMPAAERDDGAGGTCCGAE